MISFFFFEGLTSDVLIFGCSESTDHFTKIPDEKTRPRKNIRMEVVTANTNRTIPD